MEAIGTEVLVVLFPILALSLLAIYLYREKLLGMLHSLNVYVFGEERAEEVPQNAHPLFGEGQCSICLTEPKEFEVSSTCGHSFCSSCLFIIYERNYEQLKCPLCRKIINTLMISFHEAEEPAQRRQQMLQKIRLYNSRFDDNRPLIRRIQEFPYMLRRMGAYLANPRFWIVFIRSIHFFRIIFFSIFYLLLPFDLIPEHLFGIIGFVDDFLIIGLLLLFAITIFIPYFIRRHQ